MTCVANTFNCARIGDRHAVDARKQPVRSETAAVTTANVGTRCRVARRTRLRGSRVLGIVSARRTGMACSVGTVSATSAAHRVRSRGTADLGLCVVAMTRTARHRYAVSPAGLRIGISARQAAVTQVTNSRITQRCHRSKVNSTADVRRLARHRCVVTTRCVALTTIR